jgi:alpha-mannosidase
MALAVKCFLTLIKYITFHLLLVDRYAETRRKVARSWAAQLRLLEEVFIVFYFVLFWNHISHIVQFSAYKFAASQAQQYEWLKEGL